MEEWRPVKGLEGYYDVSSMGRVRSLDGWQRSVSKAGKEYYRRRYGRILKQGNSRGYRLVNLPHPEGGHRVAKVHFLVACAFLLGKDVSVNHKNGVKHDNRVENLEWASMSAQQIHTVAAGLRKQAVRIRGVRIRDKQVFEFPSQAQAAFEISGYRAGGRHIGQCLAGERKTAYGYRWERVK